MQASPLAGSPRADLKDSKAQRQTMVDCQIRTFEVTDQLVIDRFASVPRERFLPDVFRDLAYSDIGFTASRSQGRTTRYLLPPLILARLIQGGRVGSSDRVLDVAGGSGYSAAILAGSRPASVEALESDEALRRRPARQPRGWGPRGNPRSMPARSGQACGVGRALRRHSGQRGGGDRPRGLVRAPGRRRSAPDDPAFRQRPDRTRRQGDALREKQRPRSAAVSCSTRRRRFLPLSRRPQRSSSKQTRFRAGWTRCCVVFGPNCIRQDVKGQKRYRR